MSTDGIAIVGLSGRFPGARDVNTFWQNIKNGVESVSHFSAQELDISSPPSDAADPTSRFVRARGILEDVDKFDAQFFGYLPREVEMMDPQHRIFLELCWEAIEHAGYDALRYSGAIGVYGGCYMDTYFMWNLCSNPSFLARLVESIQVGSLQVQLGNDKDYLATRVAFKLGLRGPAMTVQSACSTGLVSVVTACQSLNTYQCDMALAGGVAIVLPQKKGYFYKEGNIFSPDGHCRTFDEQSAGTVFSNGAAVVLLKRVADAIADRDKIYAVIRGYALNNNGAATVSYTAPSAQGQAEVISRALTMADIDARTIGYVEAHGTATPLGDPIEIAGLTTAYRAHSSDRAYCAIGSVKANLGHLDVASGTIGLIKTALCVHEGVLPPSINFTRPNPKIDFANSPFYVNTQLRPWPAADWPRRAGVTALGIGGTNAHVVVEQAPELPPSGPLRGCSLLVLSACSEAALAMQCENLATFLESRPDISLEDVAYTLQVGRREFEYRRILVATNNADAVFKLRSPASPGEINRLRSSQAKAVFMFPGQGTQYPGMARELYHSEPVFRSVIDRCCDVLAADKEYPLDIRSYLLWNPSHSQMDLTRATADLAQTRVAQPAIFALEMGLARLLESWGVRPVAVTGHSVGEFAAASIAGMFELEDAVRLVAIRGRLMQAQPTGKMLAVRAPASQVESLLPEGIAVAAINAPELTVVSGPTDLVDELVAMLTTQGIPSSPLVTSHAFHSSMMTPVRRPLVEAAAAVPCKPATLPIASTALGRIAADRELCDPMYWGQQLMSPVRFAESVAAVAQDQDHILLEVGPGQTLTTLSRQTLSRQVSRVIIPCLGAAKAPGSNVENILTALGKLWVVGATPDWVSFQAGRRHRVALPTYPFERKRFWVEPTPFELDPRLSAPASSFSQKAGTVAKEAFASTGQTGEHNSGLAGDTVASMSEPDNQLSEVEVGHRDRILDRLCQKVHVLSGLSIEELRGGATFLELGFDSLFLVQVCQAVETEFGVPVKLRQVSDDLPSMLSLATYLQSALGETHGQRPKEQSIGVTKPAKIEKEGPIVREARFEENELAGILSVLREALPVPYAQCSLPDFVREQTHKWLNNRARTPDHVFGWVLEVPSKGIVGFVALLPVRMKIGQREISGGCGCALAVLPAYRNYSLRLFTKLMEWGDKHFQFTTTANDISSQLNKAMGMTGIPVKEYAQQFLWLLQPERAVTWALGQAGWSRLQALTERFPAAPLLKGVARLWFAGHRRLQFTCAKLAVEPVVEFTDEFETFWAHNKKDYDVTTVRDRAFLTWRHGRIPRLIGRTFVFACREEGHLRGYLAVQERTQASGYLRGHYVVTDLFYERGRKEVLQNLMNYAFEFAKAKGCSVFQVSGFSREVMEELQTQRPYIRRGKLCPYWYKSLPEVTEGLEEEKRWWPSGADGDSHL